MPVKRTTIELDEELVKAAQRVTGKTVRATVEEALRGLVATAERERQAKRSRVAAHLDIAHNAVDVEVLQADEAWR
jgi:Arc/MetJ family transcription regulator